MKVFTFVPWHIHIYNDLEGKGWMYNSQIPGILCQNMVAQEKQASDCSSWALLSPACSLPIPKGLMHTYVWTPESWSCSQALSTNAPRHSASPHAYWWYDLLLGKYNVQTLKTGSELFGQKILGSSVFITRWESWFKTGTCGLGAYILCLAASSHHRKGYGWRGNPSRPFEAWILS